jgi:undecaprenyl-diphosphatase
MREGTAGRSAPYPPPMQIWHAIVLGLVEGITEYLPVSSTGHLIIAADLLRLGKTPEEKAAVDAFNIVVQGGAILAVLGLYFPRFVRMLKGLVGQDAVGLRMLINLVIAFMPAAVIGVLAKKVIEEHLFKLYPVVAALIVGGVYMIVVERWRKGRRAGGGDGKGVEEMTPLDALKIGALQVLAMWPGTSRSMMTITGGYLVGLRPAAAAEFSFLLGMPTLLAATGYSLYKNISETKKAGGQNLFEVLGWTPVLIGMAVAAVSAALAVKWLVGFLNRHGLVPFGIYRIVAGVVLLALALGELVTVD